MNFYQSIIKHDYRYNTPHRVSDVALLEPITRIAVQAILSEAKAQGRQVMLFETYRSQRRQEDLYEEGVTQLRHVGVHHYGLAADIVKVVDGEPNWDGSFGWLRDLAVKHGLISGIDWGQPDVHHGFIDECHVQRIAVHDQNKLFSGNWYPDEDYRP